MSGPFINQHDKEMSVRGKLWQTAVVVTALAFAGCSDDRDAINNDREATFMYTHWEYDAQGGEYGPKMDDVTLHFTNMVTGKDLEWTGDARDALRHLEYLDKDRCYKNPLGHQSAEPVPCG